MRRAGRSPRPMRSTWVAGRGTRVGSNSWQIGNKESAHPLPESAHPLPGYFGLQSHVGGGAQRMGAQPPRSLPRSASHPGIVFPNHRLMKVPIGFGFIAFFY